MAHNSTMGMHLDLVWLLGVVLSVSLAEEPVCEANGECQQPTCSLYLAPSTIPGAGLGLFTGVHRRVGDVMGSGDVLVPLVDIRYHLLNSEQAYSASLDPTEDYVWHGADVGMHGLGVREDYSLTAFCPGLDGAINCHLALLNVDRQSAEYDDSGLHRSKDPGAGAFSPFHNITTYATADIPAGGELFKYYGDDWFVSRPDAFGLLPLKSDHIRAQYLVEDLIEQAAPWPRETRVDLLQLLRDIPMPSRTINALPSDWATAELVAQQGIRAMHQSAATRSLDELERMGRCLDKVTSKRSLLPQAGRGVFATRPLSKGEIVMGTPLLYTHSPDVFKVYQGDWSDRSSEPTFDMYSYQLLLNYCWHHPSASLSLCPYGYQVNYLNHNRTLANVRFQWAEDGVMGHVGLHLERSPSFMYDKATPGLFWDVVATREIAQGEELYIDYGEAWERAWLDHLERFQLGEIGGDPDYIAARDWNAQNAHHVLRTIGEQESDPYPENLQMRCLVEIGDQPDMSAEEALALWTFENGGAECKVVHRTTGDGEVRYKARYRTQYYGQDGMVYQNEWQDSDWIVREAISMIDRPYSMDMHLQWAFRHPLVIPDDIFPEAWKGYDCREHVREDADDDDSD